MQDKYRRTQTIKNCVPVEGFTAMIHRSLIYFVAKWRNQLCASKLNPNLDFKMMRVRKQQ